MMHTCELHRPLGVATYRGFPTPAISATARSPATAFCNFLGTMYANSSRETLLHTLDTLPAVRDKCIVQVRHEWAPKETSHTLQAYVDALASSTFTLSPAGLNTECYRWYEAAALGSTPIVEAVTKPSTCNDPTALLRSANAPFVFVRDWNSTESVTLLKTLLSESRDKNANRRERVRAWDKQFRLTMRDQVLLLLRSRFV
eukprot:m.1613911 g.1613911  ORF g.1613911 m.1613911 type:complete len:201 (+) comp25369_c0_seq2:1457-2059(+)